MNLVRHSGDVFLAPGPIASIGRDEIAFLKSAVAESSKGRVRVNMHPNGDDPLHEMFIVLSPDTYIRPHRHPRKSESFHLVHGCVDIVVFEDDGAIREIVRLAAGEADHAFYYRMSAPLFHTLVIRSELLVIHETTNGPFRPQETVYADFAPQEDDAAAVAAYEAGLLKRVAAVAGACR